MWSREPDAEAGTWREMQGKRKSRCGGGGRPTFPRKPGMDLGISITTMQSDMICHLHFLLVDIQLGQKEEKRQESIIL